jgi:superkiller protein 3
VRFSSGRYEEALPSTVRAVELQPDNPIAYQRLGATYHILGRLDEALAQYRRAMTFGGSPSVLANIGTLLYRQGKFAEALTNYEQSLARRPGSQQTWRSKGDALNRLGRLDEARAAWEKAASLAQNMLTANPSDVYARSFLAVCRAKLGQDAEARQLVAQAMREAADNPEVIYDGAVVHALTGRLDDSRSLLDRAIKAGYSAHEAAVDDDLRALGLTTPRPAK